MNQKIVTIGNIEYALTPEKIRRIKDAMADTKRTIDRIMRRPEEHRDQELLSKSENHLRMLEGILEGADQE